VIHKFSVRVSAMLCIRHLRVTAGCEN